MKRFKIILLLSIYLKANKYYTNVELQLCGRAVHGALLSSTGSTTLRPLPTPYCSLPSTFYPIATPYLLPKCLPIVYFTPSIGSIALPLTFQ